MKTKLLLVLTSLLFAACSDTPEKTTNKTVVDTQIHSVANAKEVVKELNKKTHKTQALAVEVSTPSGANLFAQKCASCHGKDAKKSALNTSKVIAGWDSSKVQSALKGYQDGSYGGKMKNIMQGQSKPLNDTDIKLISDYISIL